jgi:hypothetical protein
MLKLNTLLTLALAASLSPTGSLAKIAAGTGDFAVTLNGVTYNPAPGRDAKPDRLSSCTGLVKVRGVHVGYDIDCATLAVSDYTLTGAPDAQREFSRPFAF